MDLQPPSLTHRPLGICVLIGAGLLTLTGLLTFSVLLLSSGLLAFTVWASCRFLASRFLSGLAANRSLPHRGVVGESFPVKVSLSNEAPLMSLQEFEFCDPLADVALEQKLPLLPGTTRSLTYTGKLNQRGRISQQQWRATSTWPLGLFESEQTGPFNDARSSLIIPKPFLPPHLQRYVENLQDNAAHISFAPPDPSAEFRYLREFRHGDSLKSIHWPTSLRTDELLIREPEPPSPRPRRFGILVHSFAPSGSIETPGTFEMILRIVAGLLFHFRSNEVELSYQFLPGNLNSLQDETSFSKAIDRLALQTRTPLGSTETIRTAIDTFHGCDDVFVISDCAISEWKETLESSGAPFVCVDSVSLSSASQPKLKTQKRALKGC